MMDNAYNLIVEEGPDKGLKIIIPPEGARLGRSSNNDIALHDPVMSRFHCRFFFKEGSGLWAEDLGSANATVLNDIPLHESRVNVGDRITMGDTTLRVISDSSPELIPAVLFDKDADSGFSGGIGRESSAARKQKPRQPFFFALVMLAGILVLALIILWLMKVLPDDHDEGRSTLVSARQSLEIAYEKIQAGTNNIFRYEMDLKNNELSIQIDDIENQRHVAKNQHKRVDPELIANLIDNIEHAGFFEMKDEYKGRASSDVWDVTDLVITIGAKTHRVVVQNRIEPDEFKNVREIIEEFGRQELGLAALALSHDKLMEMSRNAWLVGKNMYDQRQVKNENLSLSIRSLTEMEWYLETVEPKPDYYATAIALLGESRREQQEVYEHHLFLANRAIKLNDWTEAARQLRIISERIPDRSDERHREARKRLIDVERRLQRP